MKKKIHPKYQKATITCACGSTIVTQSTRGDFQVEICSNCHPFYTGKQKLVDTAGRVERFERKFAAWRKGKPGQPAEEAALAEAPEEPGDQPEGS